MISHKVFLGFFIQYYEDNDYPRIHQPKGEYTGLRFGQAFLNKFCPDLSAPEIFYEENAVKAYRLIFDKFVDKEVHDENA